MTLDRVVINLHMQMGPGELYTAMSRVRELDHISFTLPKTRYGKELNLDFVMKLNCWGAHPFLDARFSEEECGSNKRKHES